MATSISSSNQRDGKRDETGESSSGDEEDVLISSLLSKLNITRKANLREKQEEEVLLTQPPSAEKERPAKKAVEKDDDLGSILDAFKDLAVKDDPSKAKDGENDSARATRSKLRDYQLTLVQEISQHLKHECPSILMYLPTGGGKTAIASQIVAEFEGSIGIFVHREELAWQMQKSLIRWGIQEERIGFLKANAPAGAKTSTIKIVSIQTFASRYLKKESSGDLPEFKLIIIDEAHHSMAGDYLALLNVYPSAQFLGLTATPYRLKRGELLCDVFFKLVRGPGIHQLTTMKWLVPAVFVKSTVSTAMVGRGAIQLQSNIEEIVANWKRSWTDRKTLVFCVNLKHAKAVSDCFHRNDVNSIILYGKSKKNERETILAKSASGDIPVLVTVDLISEGVDTVWIDCLLLLRPTESRGLFLQQVGRGLRPFPDKKECIVLDEVGNVFKHGFVDCDDSICSEGDNLHEPEKSNNGKAVIERWKVFNCRNSRCRSLVSKSGLKCLLCSRKALLAQAAENALDRNTSS